ncbi:hypothetical protein BW685_26240 [Burkholderia ubonensis]|uniref:Uncharacterized protein n=1 Tax=Burkholderia ubonensis TaxID=101571 RepID=A0A1R1J580_9BURK|nr:hypothetical protein BW685_26240 [Burkholderia ubonensis]
MRALTYLEQQGITIARLADLEEIMVEVADGQVRAGAWRRYHVAALSMHQSNRFHLSIYRCLTS